MKVKLSQFLDLYSDSHNLNQTQQIVRLVYFHTVEQGRETVSRVELEKLFEFAELPIPKNLPQLLVYLCGRGGMLLQRAAEYSLRRPARKMIQDEVRKFRRESEPPQIDGVTPFEFPGRSFKDAKVAALLDELKRCYAQRCWNACGILSRIIVERALDSIDARIKAATGLKEKINIGTGDSTLFSKTVREGLKGLNGAKIIGDIAAHHSTIIVDKGDVDLVLPAFRMLIKEAGSI